MAQVWEVVGGVGLGGILVREGKSIKSPEVAERLGTGAYVAEKNIDGDRLQFEKLTGAGPVSGWVSIKTKEKELLVKVSKSVAELKGGTNGSVAQKEITQINSSLPPKEFASVGLMFPGQGSQYVGMLKEVKDLPAVVQMLEIAKTVLGWDVLDLCLNGPEEKLEETKYCQPAMFIAGLAGLEKLRSGREDAASRCRVVAGLSLGEYTALCAAGVFTFEDALRLVKLRGEAMQEAAMASKQSMLSVAGLEKGELEKFCSEAAKKEGAGAACQVANCLFPKGFACAGTHKAIQFLKELVEPSALQVKLLKTSGAFHTSLMGPAAEKLGVALDEVKPRMSPPTCTVFVNATASPIEPGTSPDVFVALLKQQLTCPVLWEDCVRGMLTLGLKEYFEVGPMKQLKAMMKRIDMAAWKLTENVHV